MAAENLDTSNSSINSSAVQDNDDIRQQSCVRTQVNMGVGQRNCWRKLCTRVPAGKALYLVLLLNGIESFVFFEALSGLSKTFFVYNKQSSDATSEWPSLIGPIVVDSVGKLIYPIAGLVADVWVGKKRVIYLSMWFLWASILLLTVTALLGNNLHYDYIYYCIVSFALVLFLIGIGGFETNIIPLGLDQLQGASAEELSSYFYWYYWSRQAGALIGMLSFILLDCQSLIAFDEMSTFQPFAATFVFSIGVIVYELFNRWLSEDSPLNNPLKLIARVTYYVVTAKRGLPQHRRAFRYGEGKVPRIDLAKKDFDGIYENEEVENVKTFYQICMIFLPYLFFAFVYGFILSALDFEASKSLFTYSNPGVCFTQNLASVFDSFGLTVVIPMINFASSFVFSSSLYSRGSLRVKMGIGYVFLLLSSLSFITIRFISPPSPLASLLLLLVPASLLCLSEMFAVITALEFISAQSPQNTRGLLIGLFWFVLGLMNVFGRIAVDTISDTANVILFCFIEFVVFFAVVGLVVYVILAGCYRNRERPQPDEDDLNIRAYAASYYSFASHSYRSQ